MRYAIMILALVGVLALPRPAAAMTGNQLLVNCYLGGADGNACKSILIGFYQGFLWTTATVGATVEQK